MTQVLFQKSLQDLIKGIRANKHNPSEFISQAIVEIKKESQSQEPDIKSQAIRKLTYLQMIGYDVSWASFFIIEVMSQSRFAHKRIGYLAAAQVFTAQTEVTLLTVNLFKKEFASSNEYEIGMALNACANIATEEVARICVSDIVDLMNHEKVYVRKKAVLAMYKMYLKFPHALRITFDKLKDKLDDKELAVTSCAVNVVCELANKNPKNYLNMAPKFFALLTSSNNNWMIIKVAKLLGALVSEEPRLARKLLDPLIIIVQGSSAKSLQYECIYTITIALCFTKREDGSDAKNVPSVVKTCIEYLRGFVQDDDQNLKYLGLVGLANLMRSHPKSVASCRDVIVECIKNKDNTVRVRALELLAGIVSKKILIDLVEHLLSHADKSKESSYRDEVVASVMYMCSKEKYGLVTDFHWYISIMMRLVTLIRTVKNAAIWAEQLVEITLRVPEVRGYTVDSVLQMVSDKTLILGQTRYYSAPLIKGAMWIVGEYADIVMKIVEDNVDVENNDDVGYWIEGQDNEEYLSEWRGSNVHIQIMDAMLYEQNMKLPGVILQSILHNAMKFLCHAEVLPTDLLAPLIRVVRDKLPVFLFSYDIEVSERAHTFWLTLLNLEIIQPSVVESDIEETMQTLTNKIRNTVTVDEEDITVEVTSEDFVSATVLKEKAHLLKVLVSEPFYTVHVKAQSKVPKPSDINLEQPFDNAKLDTFLSIDLSDSAGPYDVNFSNRPTYHSSSVAANEKPGSGTGSVDPSSSSSMTPLNNAESTPITGDISHANAATPENRTFYLDVDKDLVGGEKVADEKEGIAWDAIHESARRRRKDKDNKASTTASSSSGRRRKVDIRRRKADITDVVPEGALLEDLEYSNSSSTVRENNNNVSSLDEVDITTPLERHEVLPTMRHRVVDHSSTMNNNNTDPPSHKKDRRQKKSSSKNKDQSLPSGDFLGITTSSASSVGGSLSDSANNIRKLSPFCNMRPLKLAENKFQEMIQRSSSRWGSSTASIPCTFGSEKTLDEIITVMQAYKVEVISGVAISAAARIDGMGKIFILIKVSGNTVKVDVKCLGSRVEVSQKLCNDITNGLAMLRI